MDPFKKDCHNVIMMLYKMINQTHHEPPRYKRSIFDDMLALNFSQDFESMMSLWNTTNSTGWMGPGEMGPGPGGMRPGGRGPEGMGPGGKGPDGMGPGRGGPPNMGPGGGGPANMGPGPGGPANMGPEGMGPGRGGPANMGPGGMQQGGRGPGGMGPEDMGDGMMGGWYDPYRESMIRFEICYGLHSMTTLMKSCNCTLQSLCPKPNMNMNHTDPDMEDMKWDRWEKTIIWGGKDHAGQGLPTPQTVENSIGGIFNDLANLIRKVFSMA